MKALAQREGATLFMVLLAAFALLLHRWTGENDIVISTGTGTREKPELEALIGCFINILLLRTDLTGDPSFRELVARARETTLAAYEHQDLPFDKLVEELEPQRELGRNPLTQVMLVMLNMPAIESPDANWKIIEDDTDSSQLDLTMHVWEENGALTGAVTYSTDLFQGSTIRRFLNHFEILISAAINQPDRAISELPVMTADEEHQILVDWNQTAEPFPEDATLHSLIETQAQLQPDQLAVIYDDERLTYKELNRRANQLAHHLRALGVRSDMPVAICVERSLSLVVGLLGILKAGGAYVPLDPNYPAERIAFMLRDAHPHVLITQSALCNRFSTSGISIVLIDEDREVFEQYPEEDICYSTTARNRAYIIYTSGSTGHPKGVVLDHKGRVNNFTDFNRRFGIGVGDRVLALSSLSFDMSAYDLLGTLAGGATVIIPKASARYDPALWADLIAQYSVTIGTLGRGLDTCNASRSHP